MKALVFREGLSLGREAVPVPEEDEALIRIHMAGICNTDVEITRGYLPFSGIPGHEFIGEVEACADPEWVGRRVVGEINAGCGRCSWCRSGMSRHCPDRTVLGISGRNGVFAEKTVLPVRNLIAVPEGVSDAEALFTEPLAAACEITEQVHVEPAHRVAVLGDGKLAQLVARVLVLTGCRLIVLGKHEVKLKRLRHLSIPADPVSNNREEGFDIVVEATGSVSGFSEALRRVRPRGTLVLKSTTEESVLLNTAPIVVNEIRMIGSRCGRFEPALRLLASKSVPVGDLLTAVYPLEAWRDAWRKNLEKESLKVAFDISGSTP